jgi:FlgD Ig-like domain
VERLLVTVFVWALLVATTGVFVATEALKLERPPVSELAATRRFSPTCGCPRAVAAFSFRLRQRARIDVEIVGADGEPVRGVASDVRRGRGRAEFEWDGRDDAGAVVPDGEYRVRVRDERRDRTVTFGQEIEVDTEAPAVESVDVRPSRVERGQDVEIRFELSEIARLRVRADGRVVASLGRFLPGRREAVWSTGDVEPGDYELALVARDRAGNRSEPSAVVRLEIVSAQG